MGQEDTYGLACIRLNTASGQMHYMAEGVRTPNRHLFGVFENATGASSCWNTFGLLGPSK